MITRITFDELGNLSSIEYQHGTTGQMLVKDIEAIRKAIIEINEKYPNLARFECGEHIKQVVNGVVGE